MQRRPPLKVGSTCLKVQVAECMRIPGIPEPLALAHLSLSSCSQQLFAILSLPAAAAAKVRSLADKVHPPTVRAAVLGADRDGRRYLQLQAAALLAGERGGRFWLCNVSKHISTPCS